MANYGGKFTKTTTSTTVAVATLEAPGSGMRRAKLYDLIFGSGATPSDNNFVVQLQRSTTAATGTGVTPEPLDPADAAAVTVMNSAVTVDGTKTSGKIPLSFALNQRATFRWVAAPGSEIVIPATANNGLHLSPPTALNTPQADGNFLFCEQ